MGSIPFGTSWRGVPWVNPWGVLGMSLGAIAEAIPWGLPGRIPWEIPWGKLDGTSDASPAISPWGAPWEGDPLENGSAWWVTTQRFQGGSAEGLPGWIPKGFPWGTSREFLRGFPRRIALENSLGEALGTP